MRRLSACPLLLGAALAVSAAGGASAEAPNWEVVREAGCELRSAPQQVNDGYQTVQARILVDAGKVVVESPSDLDTGFSDIGLELPGHDFIRMDRVDGKKRAVFESRYGELVKGFKAGREVEARLRFWPEFPVTGVHGARFSLMGFTKAYDEAKGCK
jgi:hypothetical protein